MNRNDCAHQLSLRLNRRLVSLLLPLLALTSAGCKRLSLTTPAVASDVHGGDCDLGAQHAEALTTAASGTTLVSLAGAVDLHCHTGPDNVARSMDDFQLARAAKRAGMRAIVLKSHISSTAARAELAQRVVPGIQIFGGISLNRSVGGLNIEALREMVKVEGQRGRFVWLPTRDTAFLPVVVNGSPVPELGPIFQVIAQNNLILATGHTRPAESLILIDAAKAAGVTKILVTHPMSSSVNASLATMQAMAARGALLELVYLATIGVPGKAAEYAQAIRTIGADHFVLTSDLGQGTTPHPEGLRDLIAQLAAQGITTAEINKMVRANPSKLLGVETE